MFSLPLPWPDSVVLLSPPWPHLPPAVRWPLLAVLVAVPLALLLWLYRHEMRLVRRLTALTLLGLRLLVLGVILALVCLQPVVARDVRHERPGRVLVVVDRSASMDLADPQRPMADKLRLARGLRMLPAGVPSALVERWIKEVAERREPTLLLPDEAGNEATRGPRAAARWDQFNAAVARADALTRTEAARRILADDGLGLIGAIGRRHAVELLAADRDVREYAPDQLAATFGPGGDPAFTDLTAPLARTQRHGRGEVIGVVLLTDGQHNSGPAPGKLARQLGERGVPVFPVVLGDRLSPPDVAVVELRGPAHNFFKGVEGVIEARVKIAGLPAGEYSVELHEDGRKDELTPPKPIAHDGKDQVYDLRFPVKMDAVGQRTLTAVVTAPEGVKDSLPGNNRLSTTVSVADDRVKVLLADGSARWEYHYLATMLARDRLIDLTTVVFDQPRLEAALTPAQEEKLGLPGRVWPKEEEALTAFGCVILGDVDADRLTADQRQRLERFVSEAGGTLIIVAGKKAMPLGLPADEADPLRKLLPIESPHELRPAEGFALTLTRAGRETRFMELEADRAENDTLWAGHPRPWGWAVAGTAKPGATVLAGWLDPADEWRSVTERERRQAVVVRHNYGFGRVLYVGLDSTWRWRFRVGDLYHHRFWGQVLRWAAADKPLAVGNEWVRFGTPQPVYRTGEAVDLAARVAEKAGPLKPGLLAGARVIALPPKEGEPERPVALVPLTRPEGRPRTLEGKLRDLPPGRYALELAVPDLSDKLLADGKPLRTTFTVAPPESKEMLRLEANAELLEDVAVSSGGRVFTPSDVAGLGDLLVAKSRPEVERVPTKLYQWWGMLALVVALLTAEWVTRKAAGLP